MFYIRPEISLDLTKLIVDESNTVSSALILGNEIGGGFLLGGVIIVLLLLICLLYKAYNRFKKKTFGEEKDLEKKNDVVDDEHGDPEEEAIKNIKGITSRAQIMVVDEEKIENAFGEEIIVPFGSSDGDHMGGEDEKKTTQINKSEVDERELGGADAVKRRKVEPEVGEVNVAGPSHGPSPAEESGQGPSRPQPTQTTQTKEDENIIRAVLESHWSKVMDPKVRETRIKQLIEMHKNIQIVPAGGGFEYRFPEEFAQSTLFREAYSVACLLISLKNSLLYLAHRAGNTGPQPSISDASHMDPVSFALFVLAIHGGNRIVDEYQEGRKRRGRRVVKSFEVTNLPPDFQAEVYSKLHITKENRANPALDHTWRNLEEFIGDFKTSLTNARTRTTLRDTFILMSHLYKSIIIHIDITENQELLRLYDSHENVKNRKGATFFELPLRDNNNEEAITTLHKYLLEEVFPKKDLAQKLEEAKQKYEKTMRTLKEGKPEPEEPTENLLDKPDFFELHANVNRRRWTFPRAPK